MTEQIIENQEQLSEWVREQFQRANKHLAEQGILFESVFAEDSRYLAPHVAIWKIKSTEGKFYWVTSGNVICDVASYNIADNARAALKHFSFNWQLQAENILRMDSKDQQQKVIAERLIKDAEIVYLVQEKDKFWQGDQS